MSKASGRVFLVIALGAFIGGTIAIQMSHMFWWVGALIGAVTAYFSYDVKTIISAIPVAFHRTCVWQPNKKWWQIKLSDSFAGLGLGLSIGCVLPFFLLSGEKELVYGSYAISYMIYLVFFSVMCFFVGFTIGSSTESEKDPVFNFWRTNPVYVYCWIIPCFLLRAVRQLAPRIPKLVVQSLAFILRFIKALFLLVHSEIRLLCAVDAALGTAIGYFAGNAIVGAIAGGLFGVANYELISVRMLKLANAKSGLK